MKKLFLAIACIVFCLTKTQAQNDAILTVEKTQVQVSQQLQNDTTLTTEEIRVANDYQIRDNRSDTILTIEQVQVAIGHQVHVCANKYDHVLVYAPQGCTGFCWATSDDIIYDVNPFDFDGNLANYYVCTFYGCGYNFTFGIYFDEPNVPNETTEETWIHGGEFAELKAVGDDSTSMYNIHWNTGENENVIYKPAGTYIAGISDMCATAYRTKIVRETPELTASCDLATGYNMLEWETNTEQASYVVSLNIYYDYDPNCLYSELVANVDYNAGSYIDTGHDSWQSPCQYHAVPVMANGEEAPLRSYWVRTISLFDLMGTQGLQQLQWTPYVTERDNAKNITSVLAYKIFDVVNGEASYRATVGSFATSYNYDPSQFNGHAAVAAQLNNGAKDELLAYSRTQFKIGDPDNVGEHQNMNFDIFPNPSNGKFTVSGATDLVISNILGQVITTSHSESGIHSISLSNGLYFVKSLDKGTTQRVVVK